MFSELFLLTIVFIVLTIIFIQDVPNIKDCIDIKNYEFQVNILYIKLLGNIAWFIIAIGGIIINYFKKKHKIIEKQVDDYILK